MKLESQIGRRQAWLMAIRFIRLWHRPHRKLLSVRIMPFLLAAVFLLQAAACSADRAASPRQSETIQMNFPKNGGFEIVNGSVPTDWYIGPAARQKGEITVVRNMAHSGKTSLELIPNSHNRGDRTLAVAQALPATGLHGMQLQVTAWMAARAPAKAAIGFGAVDQSGKRRAFVQLWDGSKSLRWVKKTGVLSVPDDRNIKTLILYAAVDGTSGAAYFDDIKVKVISRSSPGRNSASSRSAESGCGKINSAALHNRNRINTAGWQDSPYITPDGKKLYFTYTPWNFWPLLTKGGKPEKWGPVRPGHHSNPNPWEDTDEYVSKREPDGSWSAPVDLGFNDSTSDCCGVLAADGKSFYYSKTQSPGSSKSFIYVVRKKASGAWGNPEKLGPGVNSTAWSSINPFISANGKTLYFTSNRPGGFGKDDLWYSRRKPNGTWSKAINMGPGINTKRNEDQIWVSPDDKLAIFDRGAVTLYQSRFANDAWTKARPVKFQVPVQGGHVSITADGNRMYFAEPDPCLHTLVIVVSKKMKNGVWSKPVPVD